MKKLTVIAACIVLAACASAPKPGPQQAAQPQLPLKPEVQHPALAKTPGLSEAELDARELARQLQELKNKSVYFDFDESIVKPEYQDTVLLQSEFIKFHGHDVVTLEGNCDERGSAEYNLALGDRRANAVRKMLDMAGVAADQMKTVSFGEEKPRMTCHAEECWKENRRVDFNHRMKP